MEIWAWSNFLCTGLHLFCKQVLWPPPLPSPQSWCSLPHYWSQKTLGCMHALVHNVQCSIVHISQALFGHACTPVDSIYICDSWTSLHVDYRQSLLTWEIPVRVLQKSLSSGLSLGRTYCWNSSTILPVRRSSKTAGNSTTWKLSTIANSSRATHTNPIFHFCS